VEAATAKKRLEKNNGVNFFVSMSCSLCETFSFFGEQCLGCSPCTCTPVELCRSLGDRIFMCRRCMAEEGGGGGADLTLRFSFVAGENVVFSRIVRHPAYDTSVLEVSRNFVERVFPREHRALDGTDAALLISRTRTLSFEYVNTRRGWCIVLGTIRQGHTVVLFPGDHHDIQFSS
jgi:hypothetical protein